MSDYAYFDTAIADSFFDELDDIVKEAGIFEWAGKKTHKAGKKVVEKIKEEKNIMKKVMKEMDTDKRRARMHKNFTTISGTKNSPFNKKKSY